MTRRRRTLWELAYDAAGRAARPAMFSYDDVREPYRIGYRDGYLAGRRAERRAARKRRDG